MKAREISKSLSRYLRLAALPMKDQPKSHVGIALSGGVDSCSVLAAMLQVGLRPSVVSYTPSTHESTDFKYARQTAARLSLPFHPAVIEMDPVVLECGARMLAERGYRTKLEVECLTPMLRVLRVAADAGLRFLFTGDQADGYYINNNWMARNYDRAQGIPGPRRKPVREDADSTRIDELRRIYFSEDRSCSEALRSLGGEKGIDVRVPYRHPGVLSAFLGSHWRDVNEPRLKEPVWLAYDGVFNHDFAVRDKPVNLHRGDSLFSSTMGKTLMGLPHLQGPWKTPTGLYAAMARGEV